MKKIIIIAIAVLATICVAPFVLYFGCLFVGHDCNPDFIKIDRCLDAGGKWDYVNRVGIYTTNSLKVQEDKTGSNNGLHGTR